jgi:heptosyltransferase-2
MRKLLVIGPSWVGDMVMAQSLAKAVKRRWPDAEIHVVAPGWSLPLVERMPEVARGWALDVPHGAVGLGIRRRLGRRLKPEGFDQAIVLPGSFKSALVPFLAGVPRRRGYVGEMRYGLLNEPRRDPGKHGARTVDRFVALVDPAPSSAPLSIEAPRLVVDAARAREAARTLGLDPTRPAVALCPGAEYGPAKQWPLDSYADLARRLVALGRDVWIVGSAKDRPAGAAIRAAGPARGLHDLLGRTSLGEAIDVLSLTEAVVTNDSGLMHVAAALDRPVIALFGSSSPAVTPPLSPRAQVLEVALACRPCFARDCPLGHLNCLKLIGVDRVLDAVQTAIAA